MTNTPHLNITLLSQAQSQKEVTINLAFQILEMLQNTGVISMALSTPPVSPSEGDLYVVMATGTGDWTGHDGDFAYYINGGWLFVTPLAGVSIYDQNTSAFLVYNGATWASPTSGNTFATLGVNATPDSTNKLAVGSSAVLFTDIGADCKLSISKHSSTDGASVIFQDNFSSRAELGCIGDDNFQLKVSPDGAVFYQSWVIDKSSGAVEFKQNVTADALLTLAKFLCVPLASTLTIASGVVTATKMHHKIDTESGASTDDLDTINGGTGNSLLIIEPNNSSHTVVIKNGTGNIKNLGGSDVSLTGYGTIWLGMWDGTNWLQVAGTGTGGGGGSSAFSALTSSTNTTAAMVVGSGASLGTTGSGTITATTSAALATARNIGGVSFDGTADIVPTTIASINEATDTTCFPLFITASGTQSLQPKNNTSLTFNSNTGALGATSFSGAGTGLTGTAPSLTAGSATTLATARAIYGNNFDGSAALTQIIASTYGGTGNGFTKFSGAATAEKTYTLPNASCSILTDNAAVTPAQGGTGVSNSGNLTWGGAVTFSGSFTTTLTVTGSTTVTLPTSGTLLSTTSSTGSFPTLNQNTSGSAATLTTPRAIYGNNFDGSAALAQIIASTYGGTGNGFTKFSGAASTEKTYTVPNASCNLLTDNTTITVAQGGTGAGTLTGILKGNGTSAFTAATAGSDYVAPGTVTSFTKQQNFGAATITSSSNSIAWNLDNAQAAKHTATENTTLANPTNMVDGASYTFSWTQHASSAKTLAFGNAYKWPGDVTPVVSSAVNSVATFAFVCDGTKMRGNMIQFNS